MDAARLDEEERKIPTLAAGAFRDAMQETLRDGESVLVADEAALVRIFPDGRREFVKRIAPRVKIERTGKVPFRWRTTFPD